MARFRAKIIAEIEVDRFKGDQERFERMLSQMSLREIGLSVGELVEWHGAFQVAEVTELPDFMSGADAATLKVGDRVRMLVDGMGSVDVGDDEEDRSYRRGEIAQVMAIDRYPKQGLAITVEVANGVHNVFDAGDFDGLYPFARL